MLSLGPRGSSSHISSSHIPSLSLFLLGVNPLLLVKLSLFKLPVRFPSPDWILSDTFIMKHCIRQGSVADNRKFKQKDLIQRIRCLQNAGGIHSGLECENSPQEYTADQA